MTITQLRYFVAICKYGKIRTASERLFVSAPTLSVAIKNLEEELEVPLFHRNNGKLSLTEAGTELLRYANNILAECDNIDAGLKRLKNHLSVIHIGAPSTLCEHPISRLVEGHMKDRPSDLFQISQMSSHEAIEAVEEEKIDFAVCDSLEVNHDNLEIIPLLESSVGGFVHKDHHLAGRENVTPEELAMEPLLLLSRRAMPSNEIKRWFENAGVKPNFFMYQYREILPVTFAMVRCHNAPVFLLDEQFKDAIPDDITRFSLDFPLKFRIVLARKKGRILPEPAKCFYQYCKKTTTVQ